MNKRRRYKAKRRRAEQGWWARQVSMFPVFPGWSRRALDPRTLEEDLALKRTMRAVYDQCVNPTRT